MSDEVRYQESDTLRPDGMIETLRQWHVDTQGTPEDEEKMRQVRAILGDQPLIYNVRMDVSTWAMWEGMNSFGEGKIIAPRVAGQRLLVVDNHFHDERHLQNVMKGWENASANPNVITSPVRDG